MRGRRQSYGRRGPKPRWKWSGQYLAAAQAPADTIVNYHVLYDPRTADGSNESQATIYRCVGNYSIQNPGAGNTMSGMGIYLVEQDVAGGITTDSDPLAVTVDDIEVNNRLYHRMDFLPPKPTDELPGIVRVEIDTKVRRIVTGRHLLVLAVRGNAANGWQYAFCMHVLIREGTR